MSIPGLLSYGGLDTSGHYVLNTVQGKLIQKLCSKQLETERISCKTPHGTFETEQQQQQSITVLNSP